jgi:putative membrane protein
MNKVSFHLLAALTVLPFLFEPAWAQSTPGGGGYGYGPQMMWWDGGWSMMFFGPLFMIVTLAAVIAAIVFLVRWLGGMPGSGPLLPPAGKTPLDILKERYARGEIDKTEFEERRRVLGE